MAKNRVTGLQVAVYDVGNNTISDRVVREIEDAILKIVQKHTTLAHTVVTE